MNFEIKLDGTIIRTLSENEKPLIGLMFEQTDTTLYQNTVSECKNCIEDALDYIADLFNDEQEYSESSAQKIQETTDLLESMLELFEDFKNTSEISCELDEVNQYFIRESYNWLNNLLKGYYNNKIVTIALKNQFTLFKATFERLNKSLFEFDNSIELIQLGKTTFIKAYLTIKEDIEKEDLFGKLSEIFQPFEVDFSIIDNTTVEIYISEKQLLKICKKNLWLRGSFTTKKHEFLCFYIWNDSEAIANQLKSISDSVIYGSLTNWENKELIRYNSSKNEIVISDKKYEKVQKSFPYIKSPHINESDYIAL